MVSCMDVANVRYVEKWKDVSRVVERLRALWWVHGGRKLSRLSDLVGEELLAGPVRMAGATLATLTVILPAPAHLQNDARGCWR